MLTFDDKGGCRVKKTQKPAYVMHGCFLSCNFCDGVQNLPPWLGQGYLWYLKSQVGLGSHWSSLWLHPWARFQICCQMLGNKPILQISKQMIAKMQTHHSFQETLINMITSILLASFAVVLTQWVLEHPSVQFRVCQVQFCNTERPQLCKFEVATCRTCRLRSKKAILEVATSNF